MSVEHRHPRAALAAVPAGGVDWSIEESADWPRRDWPRGATHLVRRLDTVRPVEVVYDGAHLTVRTFRAAAAADVELAYAFLAACGVAAPAPDRATAVAAAREEVVGLLQGVAASGRTVELYGPASRPWWVGPRIAALVAREADPVAALHARARRLLWAAEREDVAIARARPGGVQLLQPGLPTLFRGADALLLESLDLRERLVVPVARVEVALADAFTRLDERSFELAAIPAERWAATMAALR